MRSFFIIININDPHWVSIDGYLWFLIKVIEIDLFVFIIDVPEVKSIIYTTYWKAIAAWGDRSDTICQLYWLYLPKIFGIGLH